MDGVGQVVQEFLQERRRIIPSTVADPGARVALIGTSGGPAAPEMDIDILPGYADVEGRYGFTIKEIEAGSSWTDSLANAEGAEDGTVASSQNAGSGALTMKLIETDRVLLAPPGPATLVGFTAHIWASFAGLGANIRCQLYDGSDVALGAAKSVADSGKGEILRYVFGGAADLWGTAMTIAELRADGVKLAAWYQVTDLSETTVNIDAIRLFAHYTFNA